MRRILGGLLLLLVLGGAGFWAATLPRRLPAETLAAIPAGDPVRGETWFWAGGCASCHAAPKAAGEARLRLGGGAPLVTPFGSFVPPNISPDRENGIGAWSAADFANAMLRGVAPDGSPLYPAFPYPSYARMQLADVADLWAYLQTLPPVPDQSAAHSLRFPFSIRRGVALWQRAFLSAEPVIAVDTSDPLLRRGRDLVEGAGHCGECHTPRNLAAAPELDRWLAGGPAPEGDGRIPDITPGGDIGSWSAADIAYYLETGFAPDYDSAGGSMADVQRNMAMLTGDDRAAIAAYLKAVPAR